MSLFVNESFDNVEIWPDLFHGDINLQILCLMKQNLIKSIEIVRKRIDEIGTKDPTFQAQRERE